MLEDDKSFAYEGSPVNITFKKVIVNLAYNDGSGGKILQNATGGCIIETDTMFKMSVDISNSSAKTILKVYEVIGDSRRDVTANYITMDENSSDVSFMVPKDAITTDTTYEIVVYAEGLPEYSSVLNVVVKAPGISEKTTE